MKISRRRWLQSAAVAASAVPLSGCERIASEMSGWFGESIPDHVRTAADRSIDPIFHLLSRAAYGPWPGEFDRAKQIGAATWIEEQLDPQKIDDKVCEIRAKRFETIQLDPGTCYEFKKPVLRDEIVRHTLLRAVYSKRQLFEIMVGFWTDHLNINIEKGDCIYLKPSDDRLVIRANALGKFRDLIRASATSPAMLVYLDGNENKKSAPGDIPNENYGRELLELHTLGVHGGYTQEDVYEVARCLTGWHLHTPWQRAKVYFDEKNHDNAEKHVLGHTIPAGGGAQDLERVIDIVCAHPSTAHHIATKLVTRFVSDTPPQSLVKEIADTFTRTNGDIKSMMRTLLLSQDFQDNRATKFKRPLHYIISCLRMTGADTFAHTSLLEYLGRMGHGPFQWPTPDGYPEKATHWLDSLLWRWNVALALAAGNVPTVSLNLEKLASAIAGGAEKNAKVDARFTAERLLPYFIGRQATADELAAFALYKQPIPVGDIARKAELVGLILASPAFQRY